MKREYQARDRRCKDAVLRWLDEVEMARTEVRHALAHQSHPCLAARRAARQIEAYMDGFRIPSGDGGEGRAKVTFDRVLPWCRREIDRITKKPLDGTGAKSYSL